MLFFIGWILEIVCKIRQTSEITCALKILKPKIMYYSAINDAINRDTLIRVSLSISKKNKLVSKKKKVNKFE